MDSSWTMIAHCDRPDLPVTGTVHHMVGCTGRSGRRAWWVEPATAEELAESPRKCRTCEGMKAVQEFELGR